jgi:hypothetical protein
VSAGFTPGPWTFAEDAHPYSPPAKVIALPDGTVIAEALGNDGDWPESEAEVTANARLIASAPELYEALLQLASALGAMPMRPEQILTLLPLLKDAKAAVRKARGETL